MSHVCSEFECRTRNSQCRITKATQALNFVLRHSLLDIRHSVTWSTAQQTQNQSIQVCIPPVLSVAQGSTGANAQRLMQTSSSNPGSCSRTVPNSDNSLQTTYVRLDHCSEIREDYQRSRNEANVGEFTHTSLTWQEFQNDVGHRGDTGLQSQFEIGIVSSRMQ